MKKQTTNTASDLHSLLALILILLVLGTAVAQPEEENTAATTATSTSRLSGDGDGGDGNGGDGNSGSGSGWGDPEAWTLRNAVSRINGAPMVSVLCSVSDCQKKRALPPRPGGTYAEFGRV